MSETMRDQLRAYLIKTAGFTPNAGNAEAKGGKSTPRKPNKGTSMVATARQPEAQWIWQWALGGDAGTVESLRDALGISDLEDNK